jgi:O-antigen ligase
MMVLIVLTDPNPFAAFKRFLLRPAFLLLPLSVLFIKYYPKLGRGYDRWNYQPIHIGITYNKNLLGVICLIWGIGLVWLLLETFKGGRRARGPLIIAGLTLPLAPWLLYYARSATSLSCFLIGSAIVLWTSLRSVVRRPFLVHSAAAAVVAASFAALFLDFGAAALNTLGKDPTLTGRTELWERLLGMANNPLLGAGFESFWLGRRLEELWGVYWWRPNQAHNGYLEVYISLGWTGLVLLGLMLATGYRRIVAAVRVGGEACNLRLAYFVVAIIYNFTEASFRMGSVVWIFLLLAIIGIPKSRTPRTAAIQVQSAKTIHTRDTRWVQTPA